MMNTTLIYVALCLYFVPTMIASMRGHKEQTPILLLNLLLGWTFVGYVIALVWSTTSNVGIKEEKEPDMSLLVKILKFAEPR